jgi:signal transduction histidine kinase
VLSFGIHYAMQRSLRGEVDQRILNVFDAYRSNPGQTWQNPQTGEIYRELADPDPLTSTGIFIQVADNSWTIAGKSSNLRGTFIPLNFDVIAENEELDPVYFETQMNGRDIRVYSAPVLDPTGTAYAYIQVAEPLDPLQATLRQLRTILIIGSVAATILVAGAAWLVADTALRPLMHMSATVRAIGSAGDLSKRVVPPRTGDEVQQLAVTFNAMLDRLEASFDTQRQFVADASHELRTPLTALRGNADVLLRMVQADRYDAAEFASGLTDIESEAERMGRLVQDLLTLARADVGWMPEMAPVELLSIVREATRIAAPLAGERTLEVDVPTIVDGGGYEVMGDADKLKQLLLILLDNAFTHTPPDTTVRLSLRTELHEAVIEVADDGPGIPAEHAARVFDRFYRADDARARSSGGTGLGLAIARWIAETHHGSIRLVSASSGGACFIVRLPVAEWVRALDAAPPSRQRGSRTATARAS